MWPSLDGPSPSEQICHGLMKQRSRRLLDGVLRKHMLVDSIKGYGDELKYNAAFRSPNSQANQLTTAIEGLRQIQQSLRSGDFHAKKFVIFRKNGGFVPQIAAHATLVARPGHGADFVTVSSASQVSTEKPPIFFIAGPKPVETMAPAPLVSTKSSARSAISNALAGSQNFMKFSRSQYSGDRQIIDENNNAQTRLVPIVVETKKKRPSASNGRHITYSTAKAPVKCKSSIFVPISRPKPRPNNNVTIHSRDRQGTGAVIIQVHKPHDVVRTHAEQPRQSYSRRSGQETPSGRIQENHTSQDSRSVVLANGGESHSKFRVKKIQIANGNGHIDVDGRSATKASERSQSLTSSTQSAQDSIQSNGQDFIQSKQDVAPPSLAPTGLKEGEFIKGMTFSANRECQALKHPHEPQKPIKLPSYENRMKNRFSHPLGSATTRRNQEKTTDVFPKTKESTMTVKTTSPPAETGSETIPKFYFPKGKPRPKGEFENSLQRIRDVFSSYETGRIPLDDMGLVAKACGLSLYWKGPLFYSATADPEATDVSEEEFINMWKRVATANNDAASRFLALLAKPGRNCLDFEDFLPLLKDIVETHPGLIFLKDAAEFHTRYMNTVIARIFYVINRSWSGQITASEIRRSNFLTVLSLLEEEDDINAITDYFSYEHFYVIYCKFWELDADHDLVVDKHDLMGYGDGVLSSRLLDRVLSGAVTRWDTSDHQLGRMSYVDFVWFILSEEDKKTPTSIEYWFRCMDLDGDGFVSMYEMEYFYEEQVQKLEQLDIEPLPFEDCVCQIFDIVNPSIEGKVSLKDLKRCKMTHVFYDTFFNIAKYLNNEQKDPFVAQTTADGSVIIMSDWDNFAAEEYEMLVAEEQSNKLTDMSKALIDDDEGIDILDDNGDVSRVGGIVRRIETEPSSQSSDVNSEFREINFIERQAGEQLTPAVQT